MKNKILISILAVIMIVTAFSFLPLTVNAAGVALSADQQWIEGLSTQYEYITQNTYDKQNASAANNLYWSSLSLSGGIRTDGSTYLIGKLVEGQKLQVASAWYGQDVYFRTRGSSGKGAVVKIPEYSQLKKPYKKSVKILNAYSADTGDSFYDQYISNITDKNGYLSNISDEVNIEVTKFTMPVFNKQPKNILTDAEGNYIYDLIAIGVYTDAEPDISGAAAWVLKDYISEGYGFLIGHDTMYGYGGVNPNANYVPNRADTTTPMYINNTKTNGHWNMAWLMGVNKLYTEASPYESASLILNNGDYRDKSTLYGDYSGQSNLKIKAVTSGNTETDTASRCPTNYPYSSKSDGTVFSPNVTFYGGATHSNQQLAYGKIWIEFASNSITDIGSGKLVTDKNAGLTGTNNFYVTTNGNFGLMQIGHEKNNLTGSTIEEYRILANTIMYLSQRQPCQICQSEQGDNSDVHAVKRINTASELAQIGNPDYWFTYPINGCYVLSSDIELPSDWKPIQGFAGHFNADNRSIQTDTAVFEQKGILGQYNILSPLAKGWNLGENAGKGINKISNGGGVLTGVARVEGYINALFGTPSETDYSGYSVEITDESGVKYNCVTNREGKYVVSNLPCTGKRYPAKVFTPTGKQVTQYGAVYAEIPSDFWNTCETIPLKLDVPAADPVGDNTIYEEQNAVFNASFVGNAQSVKWEYMLTQASGWIDIKYADYEYTVSDKTNSSGKTLSSLTVKNMGLENSGTLFRAVFTLNGVEHNTFDMKTPKNSGTLTVLERPLDIISPADASVWEGDDLAFTSTGSYYKSFDSGLSVVWQFRGNSDCVWENVGGSNIINNACSSESVKSTSDTIKPYANTSTLVIKNAKLDLNGYQFRAVYKYTQKSKDWASAEAVANVKVSAILCTKNPVNIKIELTDAGSVPSGATATYTAEFTYIGKTSAAPTIKWEARNGTGGEYGAIPSSITTQQTVGTPVATGNANEYKVTVKLTVTNPNAGMDTGATHYFFRAKAMYQELTAYSDSGDLSINYRIDIVQGEPSMTKRDDAGYDYTFDKLRITAPNGLRSVRVKFTNSRDARNKITYPALPWAISAKTEDAYTVFDSSYQHSAATWEIFLRQLVFSVYSDTEKIYWYIDEKENELEYNPETGKYEKHEYEFVSSPNITWTQSYSDARGKYNAKLQTYGKLVTIKNATENAKVQATLGGKNAWIGATSNALYNGGSSNMLWHTNEAISWQNQRSDTPWGNPYMFMYSDGSWSRAQNVNEVNVMTTDTINWWNIEHNSSPPASPGKWYISGETGHVHFHINENPYGDIYTGLALFHNDGWKGKSTIATQYVYLQYGHTYWFSTMFGESGDSNTSMEFFFNALGLSDYSQLNTYWLPSGRSQVSVQRAVPFYGNTGYYPIVYKTYDAKGAVPSHSNNGYGQIFHCDLVDLTAAFGSSIDKATYAWCRDNLVSKSGSQWFKFTSNISAMSGYVVEYERNDFGFWRTSHSADTESTVIKPKEWTIGREGVRVTVVDADTGVPYRPAFDLSANANTDVTRHFGYKSKTEYRNGAKMTVTSETYSSTVRALPQIIKPNGTNLAAVKAYFETNESLTYIASRTGLTKARLTGGRYKILLEPVIYLPVNGGMYAMTATETAMYNAEHNDVLRELHKNITHQALPFSMYLTEDDLGFKAWTGSITKAVPDAAIIQNLGLCILRFGSATPPPNNTEMRTNTDVYLSCDVSTNGEAATNPDNPAWVKFTVNGETLTHNNITLPAGGAQRAYVQWKTPNVAGTYTVTVTSSANVKPSVSSFTVEISKVTEKAPPDPKARDRNDYFVRPTVTPKSPEALASSWLEYSCKKEGGKWVYTPIFYSANLKFTMNIQPDAQVPTAKQIGGVWEMKSGYGINTSVTANITGSGVSSVIAPQTVLAYFPEFMYQRYWRLLEPAQRTPASSVFQFRENEYSMVNAKVHFLPLWYPDEEYRAFATLRDVWTPSGELQASGSSAIQIKYSVFDDWYVCKSE